MHSLCSRYRTRRVGRRGDFERRLCESIPRVRRGTLATVMNEPPVDAEEEVELTPEELADLDAGMEEAERGEGMDAFEFLRQLRAGTWCDSGGSKDEEASPDGEYELTPEDENALEESIAEIRRGECGTAKDLLTGLRAICVRDADDDLWPLLISDSARREIAEAQQASLQNRQTVPEALGEELRATFERLLETPAIGALVPTRKRKFMRRSYLARINYDIYYLNSAPGIEILALWHASRRPPRGL
jgi:plasmid stabilization system protein ParE/predicted transcriptional regulator